MLEFHKLFPRTFLLLFEVLLAFERLLATTLIFPEPIARSVPGKALQLRYKSIRHTLGSQRRQRKFVIVQLLGIEAHLDGLNRAIRLDQAKR